MAYIPDIVAAAIRSLNRKNAVPAAWAVNPADVVLVSVVPRTPRILDVTLRGKASQPTYGTITAQVYRQDIADYFSKVTLPALPNATSVRKLLPDLTAQLGIDFALTDFVDLPITWANNTAQVTFQATDSSLFWYGTATVTVGAAAVDINDVYTLANLTLSLKSANRQQWIDFYSATGKRIIDESKVSVSDPQDPASLGLTSSYNSVIALTAKPNSGLTGVRYVYYTRTDLAKNFEGAETYVADDFTGTLYDALANDNIGLRSVIDISTVEDAVLDASTWPVSVQLKPNPTSFKVVGTANIKILRYQDDVKKVVLNYNSINSSMSSAAMLTAIQLQVKKASTLQLEINVGAGVTVCAATTAEAAFSFKPLTGFGKVNVYLTNRGNIYGRGSDFGAFTVPSVAGDAINVSNDFAGEIVINNLGTIAGGGGGGTSASGYQYNVYGGGGMPLGKTSSNSGSTYFRGSDATLTAPGGGGSATVGSYTYFGGQGGNPGQPGKFGRKANTSAVPYVTTINSDDLPRPPGKAITGNLSLITWELLGNVKPAMYSKLDVFKAYLDTLTTASKVEARQSLTVVTDYTKPIVVQFTGTSAGANGITDNPYGSAWGDAVLGMTFAQALVHAFEDENCSHAGFVWGGYALVEFEPTLLNVSMATAITRNNVSTATLTGTRQARKIGRMVYYDYYRDEVVECFPSQKKGFTTWSVPTVVSLKQANGELSGFKS